MSERACPDGEGMAADSGMRCHQKCGDLERVTEDAALIPAMLCAVVIAGVLRNFIPGARNLPIAITHLEEGCRTSTCGCIVGSRRALCWMANGR
jgi:hypothetical protein